MFTMPRKKILCICCLVTGIAFTPSLYANWYQDIINAINAQGIISNQFLSAMNAQASLSSSYLNSIDRRAETSNLYLNSIDDTEKLIKNALTGKTEWGAYQSHDYQSYGEDGESWGNVMTMASKGKGAGELGKTIQRISQEFPIDKETFNAGINHKKTQEYYAIKSQTILATRTLSQLDYDKIQDQITYQQMLQKQIGVTDNLKAAVDLSNRINVEGNLINLEILRQAALLNHQQAITEQGQVNSALQNAKFLSK